MAAFRNELQERARSLVKHNLEMGRVCVFLREMTLACARSPRSKARSLVKHNLETMLSVENPGEKHTGNSPGNVSLERGAHFQVIPP